jgi:hypothetical protein
MHNERREGSKQGGLIFHLTSFIPSNKAISTP